MKKILSAIIISILFCFAKCNSAPKGNVLQNKDSVYSYKAATADGTGKFYFNREIAPVMGAANSAWLNRDEREKEENTDLAIKQIKLPPDAVIADIGAGTGYYTFKLAPKVPQGKVYAVEVQDEMIEYLDNNKKKFNSTNVEVVKGGSTSPNLPDNSVDLVIMVDVYHELQYPHEMLLAISKSLKSNGKILLIEYRGEDPCVHIKALHKTTVQQLNKELAANGFKLSYRSEVLLIQHFLLYEKN